MKLSDTTYTILTFVAGFLVAALLMFAYGLLLGGVWEQIYRAPWPSIGSTGQEALLRARATDGLFGLFAGALLAIVVTGKTRTRVATSVAFLAGVLLYAYKSATDSTNQVSAFLESPMPALTLGFAVVVAVRYKKRAVMQREA